jgi:hypothetical protein
MYQSKIDASKERIAQLLELRTSQEGRLNEALTNEFLSRNVLQLKQIQQQTGEFISKTDQDIKDESDKIQTSIDKLQSINEEINAINLNNADKKDIQTFKFVAEALNSDLDSVAKWFIVAIIFVFDPLAICLVLAYNVVVFRKIDDRVFGDENKEPVNQVQKKTTDSIAKDFSQTVEEEKSPSVEEPIIDITSGTEFQEIKDDYQIDTTLESPSEPKKEIDDRDDFFKRYFK